MKNVMSEYNTVCNVMYGISTRACRGNIEMETHSFQGRSINLQKMQGVITDNLYLVTSNGNL